MSVNTATSEVYCPHCGNLIDPDNCWCGDPIKFHGLGSGHAAVPYGCRCHFARKRVLLHELPVDDPLRNTPLKEIGGEIRALNKSSWKSLKTWKIGGNTFNQVTAFWSQYYLFSATVEE